MDKCKENMKKRRMLFQREQAERKDINDTSVNNTVIDGDSGIQTYHHSREHSSKIGNQGKRESQVSSSISDISQSWLQDPEWHRYSQKLEKMAKWQSRCGIDPIDYFGGGNVEGETLESMKRDPRISGKWIVHDLV